MRGVMDEGEGVRGKGRYMWGGVRVWGTGGGVRLTDWGWGEVKVQGLR